MVRKSLAVFTIRPKAQRCSLTKMVADARGYRGVKSPEVEASPCRNQREKRCADSWASNQVEAREVNELEEIASLSER